MAKVTKKGKNTVKKGTKKVPSKVQKTKSAEVSERATSEDLGKKEPMRAKPKDAVRTVQAKKKFIEALRSSLGVVSVASNLTGTHRARHYEWIEKDPKYKAEVEAIAEEAIDFAETSLYTQIKDANTTATIFYLKTKGKKRGYIETQAVINKDVSDLQNMSDEELDEIIYGK